MFVFSTEPVNLTAAVWTPATPTNEAVVLANVPLYGEIFVTFDTTASSTGGPPGPISGTAIVEGSADNVSWSTLTGLIGVTPVTTYTFLENINQTILYQNTQLYQYVRIRLVTPVVSVTNVAAVTVGYIAAALYA